MEHMISTISSFTQAVKRFTGKRLEPTVRSAVYYSFECVHACMDIHPWDEYSLIVDGPYLVVVSWIQLFAFAKF